MLNNIYAAHAEALVKEMKTAATISSGFLDQYLKDGNQHLNAFRQSFDIVIKNSDKVLELINKLKNNKDGKIS